MIPSASTSKGKKSKTEAEIHQELSMLPKDQDPKIGKNLNKSQVRKSEPNLNAEPCSVSNAKNNNNKQINNHILTVLKPHDANCCPSQLHYELQVEIFSRISCCKYWKLQFLNKQFSQLLKSGQIFRVRQENGLVKPYVFMLTRHNTRWTMFDKDFKNIQMLPKVPSDDKYFMKKDKQTICAGTQLIVVGRERLSFAVWRYELEENKWFKDPEMFTPRVNYASASHGTNAFFAGGYTIDENGISKAMEIAEKYNAETKSWIQITKMHKHRKYCSGCFFHDKFYVIGGQDENDELLTCGEIYNEKTDSWTLIPNMLEGLHLNRKSPPLLAVVEDNLYMLETSTNELHIYDVNANSWEKLGTVPVIVGSGWGVAFKSIGDRLLLIGALTAGNIEAMTVFTCRPSTDVKELIWEKSNNFCGGDARFNDYIWNCCVMFA